VPVYVDVVVEGEPDEALAEKVLRYAGFEPLPAHGKCGRGYIDSNIARFNHAADRTPWFVLRDWDADDQSRCAAELVRRLLPEPARKMRFRIAVRSVESWLMADRVAMARFLEVEPNAIPEVPDTIPKPKSFLVKLAGRSKNTIVRKDMVPESGASSKVGKRYNLLLTRFALEKWGPGRAAHYSPSLRKCIAALRDLRTVC
jgi:hypothetical protein